MIRGPKIIMLDQKSLSLNPKSFLSRIIIFKQNHDLGSKNHDFETINNDCWFKHYDFYLKNNEFLV